MGREEPLQQGWPKRLKCQKLLKTNHFPIKNNMISSQKKFQPNQSFLRPPEFPLKVGSDPFKGEKKNLLRLWGSWYSNRPAWTHDFNAKIGFKKYAPSPEILLKKCPKLAFQTKPAKFYTLWQYLWTRCIFFKTVFCVQP